MDHTGTGPISPSRLLTTCLSLTIHPCISCRYGVMMVHCGDADGMVSGAIHTTAATVRPAMQVWNYVLLSLMNEGGKGGRLVYLSVRISIPP